MNSTITVKSYSEISDRDYADRFRGLLKRAGESPLSLDVKYASDNDFGRINFVVRLSLPKGKPVKFLIETQPLPRPSQFPFAELNDRYLNANISEVVIPLLAAPYISKRVAELCESHGWSWFDLSGNCRIKVPETIYIERTGFKPIYKQPRPLANLGTAASARVLRALLAPQNSGRSWTQTELKRHCEPGVSFGLVNKVVAHLREEAWLEQFNNKSFRVKDAFGLLEVWRKSYRFDRHRRIGYFTLLKVQELQKRLQDLNSSPGEAAYAVFTAADFQAPSVRQNKTWLYVNDAALDDFEERAEAKRVDSGANLIVLIPEDDGVFYLKDAGSGGRLACTNPVQTWLDLNHAGGRGDEAGEAILSQCLKPMWKGAAPHV